MKMTLSSVSNTSTLKIYPSLKDSGTNNQSFTKAQSTASKMWMESRTVNVWKTTGTFSSSMGNTGRLSSHSDDVCFYYIL